MITKYKKLGMGLAVLLLVAIVFMVAKTPSRKPGVVVPSYQPSGDAITVVTKYLQAQEGSISSSQPSPSSWIDSIKPISTTDWYNTLVAGYSGSSTGNGLSDYNLAHSLGYSVRANVGFCAWADGPKPNSATAPTITCTLTDTVYDKTNQPVASNDLPFGWSHSGLQPYPVITVVNQNGLWLVNGVTTEAPF